MLALSERWSCCATCSYVVMFFSFCSASVTVYSDCVSHNQWLALRCQGFAYASGSTAYASGCAPLTSGVSGQAAGRFALMAAHVGVAPLRSIKMPVAVLGIIVDVTVVVVVSM